MLNQTAELIIQSRKHRVTDLKGGAAKRVLSLLLSTKFVVSQFPERQGCENILHERGLLDGKAIVQRCPFIF